MEFSADTRIKNLQRMKSEKLDLLIIGGGITGAGISLAASASGMKTGLIEMQDFAAGTSSRSTKLIHGGLRYLKQFEVEMVADVSREREIIRQNASHIVRPTRMMLPIFDESGVSFNAFSSKVALKLYDELADVGPEDRHSFITREEAAKKEPALENRNLAGAGLYLDYTSDDARLTIEILKKAHEYHALLASYVKVIGFTYNQDGKIDGVEVQDQLSREEFSIQASVVMNATGAWAFQTKQLIHAEETDRMRPTKGIHLVFSKERLPVHAPIYLDSGLQDQRMIFIIPRKEKTYVGTTDTDYNGDLIQPEITLEDVTYLLKVVNKRFPDAKITLADVEASWAGLRPLVHQENVENPSEISRGSVLLNSEEGLLTITGGKLTDYRRMAEEALEMIVEEIKLRTGACYPKIDTSKIKLSGGEETESDHLIALGKNYGLNEQEVHSLMKWYGSNTEKLLRLAEQETPFNGMPLIDSLSLQYALNYEMTLTPIDYFSRRTDYLLFDLDHLQAIKDAVVDAMADYYQWSNDKKEQLIVELEDSIRTSQLQYLRDGENDYAKKRVNRKGRIE